MDTLTMVIIAIVILGGISGLYIFAYMKEKKSIETAKVKTDTKASMPLKLQAYERLVLLADRIALPNVISRVNDSSMSAKEMQVMLTQSIKQEFEHNVTQQIYVTPEAWDAIRNLKEQNIMVVNQVAATLPPTASAADLNKKILEVLMSQANAGLHELVSQALNFEAKKLMKQH